MRQVGQALSQQVFWDRHQLRAVRPYQGGLDRVAWEHLGQDGGVNRHLPQVGGIAFLDPGRRRAIGFEVRGQHPVRPEILSPAGRAAAEPAIATSAREPGPKTSAKRASRSTDSAAAVISAV